MLGCRSPRNGLQPVLTALPWRVGASWQGPGSLSLPRCLEERLAQAGSVSETGKS